MPSYSGFNEAASYNNSDFKIFGKPSSRFYRRMGVALAMGETLIEAQAKADSAAESIKVLEK